MYLYRLELFSPKRLEEVQKNGLVPCIPSGKIRLEGENNSIPRICVSKTVDGCLTALGENMIAYWVKQQLENNPMKCDTVEGRKLKLMVLRFDTQQFSEKHYWNSFELYQKNYVPDAYITKEYWILKPCKPANIYIRKLLIFRREECLMIPYGFFRRPILFLKSDQSKYYVDLFRDSKWKTLERITIA